MLNDNLLKGKWNEIKGGIREKWGDLTDDELEHAKGSFSSLVGVIQQRYGSAQEEVRKGLNDLFQRFSDPKNKKLEEDQPTNY